MEDDLDINPPEIYKYPNLLLFKNTSFQPLFKIPYSCDRTIESVCYNNLSLDQCIEKCHKSKDCGAGFLLTDLTTNTTTCAPLRTAVYPDSNYSQDLYDVQNLTGKRIDTFLKNDLIPYPPNNTLNIYYRDFFQIKNVNKNTLLATRDDFKELFFGDVSSTILSVISMDAFFNRLVHKKLRFGDKITLVEKDTSYIIRIDGDTVSWVPRLSPNLSTEDYFIILSDEKLVGEEIKYGDKFFLATNLGSVLVVDTEGILKVKYLSPDQITLSGMDYIFTFLNRNPLYICDKSVCRELSESEISQIIQKPNGIFYLDNRVFRDARCSGYCKIEDGIKVLNLKSSSEISHMTIFLIILMLLLVVIFFVIYK